MFAWRPLKRCFSFSRTVEQLISNGKILVDPTRSSAVTYFKHLSAILEDREKKSLVGGSSALWSKMMKPERDIKGAYIYGSVGSGKTMLMDLFYEKLAIRKKSRKHFNQFMLEFHSNLRAFRIDGTQDPMSELIKSYRERMDVLCLDEFQVTDIADAMILRNLLSSFIDSGMIIVATSNRHPDELYLNGIQRASFLPCINVIKSSLEVINLSSSKDYRTEIVKDFESNLYFERFLTPINDETSEMMNEVFLKLSPNPECLNIDVLGRHLVIKRGYLGGAAMFTFQELFVEPKSAADYIKICSMFKAVFVTDFPAFNTEMRSEVRRFITFIDQVYENRVGLYLQCEVDILENLETLQKTMSSSHDETFALSRTMSRLKEIKRGAHEGN